jgi:glutathione peroxidase
MTASIYDIPLKSWDGQENMLNSYKGKVTMFINVTADCGNAPQYGIIEMLYQKYKDRGFEVVAIPTNDYCGPGITYDQYECGIDGPEEARDYAKELYNVTYGFSELVTSMVGTSISNQALKKLYPGRTESFPRKLLEGEDVHPIYQNLAKGLPMFGNFEKFLVNKNGKVIIRYANSTLMDAATKNGFKETSSGEDFKNISNAIEELLEDKDITYYTHPAGTLAPYAIVL